MVNLAAVRNRLQIEPNYTRLAQKGFPEERALAFARGAQGLLGHPTILSESGIILHSRVQALLASGLPASNDTAINQFDEILPQLPTVVAPHLSLFVSPSSMLNEEQKQAVIAMFGDKKYGCKILAITDGCANQCFSCGDDAPAHMRHMPYPMVAAIANEILSVAGEKMEDLHILLYYRSDPMHYRDIHFNADVSDVVSLLQSAGIGIEFITHGWWKGDRYAQQAAEKLYERGFRADRLSVNLFHERIAENSSLIDSFVERFQTAIKLLRPKKIYLMGEIPDLPGRPEVFSRFFIEQLFKDRIAPGYKGNLSSLNGPYLEGRARRIPGAAELYPTMSISSYPYNKMICIGQDGRVNILHTRIRVKGEKCIGEVFSGADDFGFIALMYHWMLDVKDRLRGGNLDYLLSEVDGSSYLTAFNEFSRLIEQKGGPSIFKYGDLCPKDLRALFDKLKDLPLVLPENFSFFTFEQFLTGYWEKIKNKYPQFNHDFYLFFEECLKLSPSMDKTVVNGKLCICHSDHPIYNGVLDEEDWRTIASHFESDHFEGDILESAGFYGYLDQYTGKDAEKIPSPEQVRHLYSLIKGCPTFDHGRFHPTEEFDYFSFPPEKLRYFENEEEELPYRLFPG
ncbi:MAG: hypothetical protein WC624_02830 [Candidatus Margulisiibacteriota bacterium]